MSRVKEHLNLVFHGIKVSERAEMFDEVREWLAEMDPNDLITRMAVRMKVEAELRDEVRKVTDGEV